jgi:acyl dehydratase
MRKLVDYRRDDDAARRGRGEPVAKVGASPGFRDLKWLKPVFPGDTITYAGEVLALRASESRPEWGVMMARNTGTNQNGDLVLSFESAAFIERRPQSAP